MPMRYCLAATGLILAFAAPAFAASVDIGDAGDAGPSDPFVYIAGDLYPGGDSAIVGGESFTLAPIGSDGHIGIVPDAAFRLTAPTQAGDRTLGFAGPDHVVTVGTGVKTRDHVAAPSDYSRDDPAGFGEITWSDAGFTVHLDAIRTILPAGYAHDALTTITLSNTFPNGGNPSVAAANYGRVPKRAVWGLVLLGLSIVGMGLRRRRPLLVTA